MKAECVMGGKNSIEAMRTSRRWKSLLAGALTTFFILLAPSGFSQGEGDNKEKAEEESELPPTPVELERTLVPQMRDTLTLAVQGLRQRAHEDPDFFFVSPKRNRRKAGHKEVAVRYSKKIVERPVYEYETYKTVVNTGGGSEQGAGKLKTVTRRRRVKKIGTKKEERLVRDKEGDIVRMHRQPIWESGGPDEHFPGFFAQNAMGLYLCAKAGVPMDDELMDATSHNVANLALGYGLTDRTWDLAWLTVAMVNMPKDDELFREASERMVAKLLLGQIREGDGEGLWGPVCINPDVLRALVDFERELYGDEVQRWKDKLKDSPDRKLYKEKLAEADERFKEYRNQYPWVSQLGFEFRDVRHHSNDVSPHGDYLFDLQTGTGMDSGRKARLRGLPTYIYEEQLADLESTSIALFALREAADNGYLPDQGWVPESPDGEPLVSSRDTNKIIRSAFEAVAQRVSPNGTADEANLWMLTNAFEGVAGIDLPYSEDRIEPLSSDVTFTSSARACMALLDAAAIMEDTGGLDKQSFKASRRTVRAMVEGFLTDDMRGMKVGGHAAPYEFVFQFARAIENPMDLASDERTLWAWMGDYLLQNHAVVREKIEEDEEGENEAQSEDESDDSTEPQEKPPAKAAVWLKGDETSLISSIEKFIPKDRLAAFGGDREELTKKRKKKLKNSIRSFERRHARRLTKDVVATVYAGQALLAGIRPSIAGVWAWNARQPRLATIKPVVQRLADENGAELSPAVIDPTFPTNAATGIPLLMISGGGEFSPAVENSVDSLIAYLKAEGRLAVEAPATDAGIGFLKAVQKEISNRLPDAEVVRLPPMADDLPKVVAIRNKDGLRAVFLPVAATREQMRENVFSPGAAKNFVYILLEKSLPEDYFDPQYAIQWDQILDFEEEMRRRRREQDD
ncbi:MAG: hypothetical protein ACOCUY_02400 [Verrucomicrobiota bacterium]